MQTPPQDRYRVDSVNVGQELEFWPTEPITVDLYAYLSGRRCVVESISIHPTKRHQVPLIKIDKGGKLDVLVGDLCAVRK